MRPVCYDVCIALILIAKSPKQVINLVIHLGNPGLYIRARDAKTGEAKIVHRECLFALETAATGAIGIILAFAKRQLPISI